MNVTFAPELNRPAFTIHLDWLEVGGQNAEPSSTGTWRS